MKQTRDIRGFTLMELMIVIMIIGVLTAVLVPKIGSAVQKSGEASSKGSLASIRSSLSLYYTNNDGKYPTDNLASLSPNYLPSMPVLKTPNYHPDSVLVMTELVPSDSGEWSYDNNINDVNFGAIRVGCTHNDVQGNPWSTY